MNNEIVITNHSPQDITITEQDNQLIFVNGGGNVIGITDVKVNGTSVVTNNIAYVMVPTTTSQITNNSGYITINDIPNETDPTVPSYVKSITLADINKWNNKQEALVSGTNIKTINSTSLLGSGNIEVGGAEYSAGDGINISNNVISNTITSYNNLSDLPTIPTKTSDLLNDNDFVSEDDLAEVAFTGSYNSLSDTPIIPSATSDLTNDSNFVDTTALNNALSTKQDSLVSGTNIKTINNTSLLGSGNISISGGSATDVQINGTSIVSNNVADIKTQSIYDGNTNKLATMHDLNYNLNQKQDTLVSGTNIKTINNNSLLGSGNIKLEKSFLKAKISADVNSTNSYTEINNMVLDVNRGNLSVENGKIKIGSGITYIKITINLGTYSSTQSTLYSYFLLNGNNYGNWTVKQINDFDSIITTEIIGVSENDIISFNIYTSNNSTLNKDRTIIIVEEI